MNKQTKKGPQLKLINYKGIKGYTISNIKEVLTSEKYAGFEKWMHGQTVGIYKGEDFIYLHDFEQFLAGLPAWD